MAKPSWITLPRTSGIGATRVEVAAESNGGGPRRGSFTVKTASGLTKVVNVSQKRQNMIMLEYNSSLSSMFVTSKGGVAEYILDVLTSGGVAESGKVFLTWVSTTNYHGMRVQGVIVNVIDLTAPNGAQAYQLSLGGTEILNSGGSMIGRLAFKVGISTWPNPSNPPIQINTNFNMRLIAEGFPDTDFTVTVSQTNPNYE